MEIPSYHVSDQLFMFEHRVQCDTSVYMWNDVLGEQPLQPTCHEDHQASRRMFTRS